MPKSADIGSKRLISLAPDAWVQWVMQRQDVVAREIVSSEFQWLSRDTDVLVKAYNPQLGHFLVLNELQLRYTNRMPRRMRAYAALAEEKYNLPVYPVLVNILPPTPEIALAQPAGGIATRYESEIFGLRAIQDYQVINLWEVDAQIVFEQPIPSLLPFVPILRSGGEQSVVQQAVQELRADEQLSELEPLLAFFASFVLSTNLVQQIMRWDMAILHESPWYQEIFNKGEKQGEKRGEERGEKRGQVQGLLSGIESGLELKFGSEGLELMPTISQISDVDILKRIQRGLWTVNSLEELRQIYQSDEG